MSLVIAALLVAPPLMPEDRALSYLSREVPAWSAGNHCYSCHNNGNASRALYAAVRLGYAVPARALPDTTHWLTDPSRWDDNGGSREFSDKDLARLHFALALLDAVDAGVVKERVSLRTAAAAVAARQLRDGSWSAGPRDNLGSPTTYGTALVTAESRRLLARTEASRYAEAIHHADTWLAAMPVKSVVDAAAVLLTLENSDDRHATSRRKECLALLRRAESRGGGWGPFANAPPEVFDTALIVIALSQQPATDEIRTWLRRGRAYLTRTQRTDGSWPETTRPSGSESYAERLSTSGWAARALLATK